MLVLGTVLALLVCAPAIAGASPEDTQPPIPPIPLIDGQPPVPPIPLIYG